MCASGSMPTGCFTCSACGGTQAVLGAALLAQDVGGCGLLVCDEKERSMKFDLVVQVHILH